MQTIMKVLLPVVLLGMLAGCVYEDRDYGHGYTYGYYGGDGGYYWYHHDRD